jgi:hypothetical protein
MSDVEPELKKVAVYVRLDGGDEDARILSFKRPSGITSKDALEAGIAVDGDDLVVGVTADGMDGGYPDFGQPFGAGYEQPRSLSRNLLEAQRGLAQWLSDRGYEVEFR